VHLFHEIEYAHIIVFYLGLGLIIQGLALAIVNREVKLVWKYSTAQTMDELVDDVDLVRKDTPCGLGNFLLTHGLADVKKHLDIHLVRIMFLEIMNLPSHFAYNEYINHALDTTTLKMSNNTWYTWLTLILVIQGAAYTGTQGLFMGIEESSYRYFMLYGLFLVIWNCMLLVVVDWTKDGLLRKLGGSRNIEVELDNLQKKWVNTDAGEESMSLRDVVTKVKEDKANRKKKANHSLRNAVSRVKKATRLSAIGRSVRRVQGVRTKPEDLLREKGVQDPDAYRRFQSVFMKFLRVGNLLQAFYISLIIAHWGWYADTSILALLELAPLLFIYLFLTPRIVRRFAMIIGLGKPDPRALSETIEYMEHNDQALHQVAELLLSSKQENESIEDIFNDWDINGDGELSFKELEEAMTSHNMHMHHMRMKAMWRKIDIDSSGTITCAEFRRAIDPYLDLVTKELEAKASMLAEAAAEEERGGSEARMPSVDSM